MFGVLVTMFFTIVLAGWIRQYLMWVNNPRRQEPSAPASEEFVISLPQRIGEGNEDKDCVICLEELAAGDVIRILPCNHEYHAECVDRWLQTQQRQCPMCKCDITHANTQAANTALPALSAAERHRWCCFSARAAPPEDNTDSVELELLQSTAAQPSEETAEPAADSEQPKPSATEQQDEQAHSNV
eukprot:TRINITY_DN4716_c0_g1_i4.p2 TRINITY_DN4716_c0_g1~~TRINITY_DN4716_c0_g1_i4.p2  ORF type:complete len:186 (+),score=55.03 TRINITY_DN4716_c0_g1_i4:665-1222(+)